MPLGRYYDILLTDPPPYRHRKPEIQPPSTNPQNGPADPPDSKITTPATTNPASPSPGPSTDAVEKARIVFGTALAGPAARAERLRQMREKGKMIAGVLVPPKPEEPDHCCMSGCVNCVWDTFREDMEEWLVATAEAGRRVAAAAPAAAAAGTAGKTGDEPGPFLASQPPVAASMDDDGGGSEANWDSGAVRPEGVKISKDLWSDDLYRDIPVGIREFMKQEKKLKEKHKREGTSGG